MPAKVSITTTAIGSDQNNHWRSVSSPRPLAADEINVKIEFGIASVRGGRKQIEEALKQLQAQGTINRYYLGLTGSVGNMICTPPEGVISAIRDSGNVENDFTLSICSRLKALL